MQENSKIREKMKSRNIKIGLSISVALNVLLCCGIVYIHRGGIRKRVEKILNSSNLKKIDRLAGAMNETIFEPYYDAYIIGENLKTIKVAFIGNSITWHDPSEKNRLGSQSWYGCIFY